MDRLHKHQIIYWDQISRKTIPLNLINEEALLIYIQDKPFSTVMRTPGREIPHVAGFCFTEGIIDTCDDYNSIDFYNSSDTNKVMVMLTPSRLDKVSPYIERRGFVRQTSSGIYGKQMINDLFKIISPQTDDFKINIKQALNRLENLTDHQPLRGKTLATHAAAIYSLKFELLSLAEDVGRHNAVDKAIGKLFLDDKLDKASVLILSSRVSYELIQKAARAQISVVLAISRPTSLAVELASQLNITLASLAKGGGLYVFCGENRLRT